MSDEVNHPKHYNEHPTGIECIEVVEHFNFNVGNALKYLWRSGLKKAAGEKVVEAYVRDLEKACWYIQREIHRARQEARSKKDAGQ